MVMSCDPNVASAVGAMQEQAAAEAQTDLRAGDDATPDATPETPDAIADDETGDAAVSVAATDEGAAVTQLTETHEVVNEEPQRAIIRFDANVPRSDVDSDGDGEGDLPPVSEEADSEHPYGKMDDKEIMLDGTEWVLPANAFAVDGYRFVRWSTTKDGKDIKDDENTQDIDESFVARPVDDKTKFKGLAYEWTHEVENQDGSRQLRTEQYDLSYAQRDIDGMKSAITLYAQWEKMPAETEPEKEETDEDPLPVDNIKHEANSDDIDKNTDAEDGSLSTGVDPPVIDDSKSPDEAPDLLPVDKSEGDSERQDTKDEDRQDAGADTRNANEANDTDGNSDMPVTPDSPDAGKSYVWRLIVGLDAPRLLRADDVVLGEVDGTYLLGFDNVASLMEAQAFYRRIASFAELDIGLDMAGDVPQANNEPVPMTAKDNPFDTLSDGDGALETSVGAETEALLVALLDTGAPMGESLAGSVSMLGDDGVDRNGHARLMFNAMCEQNPDVRVMSVKVLDDTGHGTASSVYAGIIYAVDNGAEILNLSFAGADMLGNQAIREAVQYALDKGVVVVAAAGNGGYDAGYVTPANVEGVFTVGAAENGQVRADSNCGECVDAYVDAPSTSVAAAKVSGQVSLGLDGWRERVDKMSMGVETPAVGSDLVSDGDGVDAAADTTVYWGVNGSTLYLSASSGTNHTSSKALSEITSASSVPWYSQRADITTVVIDGAFAPTSTAYWFFECSKLAMFTNWSNLDVSDVTNMDSMFYDCSGVSFNPDVSSWDTSKVTNMYNMFGGCSGAAFNPDVSNWNTSSVTDMYSMFDTCSGAAFNPDVSNWNTSSVTDMYAMFYTCSGASFDPDVSSWDTSEVTDMRYMFYGCSGAAFSPNVSNWNTSSVTNMRSMFYNCFGASFNPDVSSWGTSKVTDMSYMFYGCSGDVFSPNVSNWDTSSVTDMHSMFYDCSGASFDPDVSSWDTSEVMDMSYMFRGCSGDVFNPDVSKWGVSKVTDMEYMFVECSGASFNPDVSKWDVSKVTNMNWMFGDCSGAALSPNVSNWNTSSVTNMGDMFYNCSGISFNPDVSSWDTSKVTNMSYMFYGCSGAALSPNVSNWDTSNVTNMCAMFYDCFGASFNPDVSSWDTSEVTDMSYLFRGCSGDVFNPDVSKWDTSSVTNMHAMFDICSGVSFNPDVSSWDTSRVTNMGWMFDTCSGAAFNPNVSNWDTSSVTDMYAMFADCSGVSFNPDVSNWNTSSVTDMNWMFGNCSGAAFTSLDVSKWDFTKVTGTSSYLGLQNCNNLKELKVSATSKVTGVPEHEAQGDYAATWGNADRNVTGSTAADMVTTIDAGNGAGTWKWESNVDDYVLLDSSGTLTFFKAARGLTPGTDVTVTDVDGTTRTGQLYAVDLDAVYTSEQVPWYGQRLSIKFVRFAQVTKPTSTVCWFYGCSNLADFDSTNLDTSSITNMGSMFYYCSGASFNPGVSSWDTSKVTNMSHMFRGCSGAAFNPNVSSWNTSSVTNMYSMFSDCSGALFNPDVSNWNMSRVTNMGWMFARCSGAAFTPDVSNWNTSSVTNMYSMFSDCSGVSFDPDVSAWDTSEVTDMGYMFKACSGDVFNPDVSKWDTSKVVDMGGVFCYCSGTSFNPDVSNWNTSSVTDMGSMFYYCSGAIFNPDVSNWNTSSVTDMSHMFRGCSGAAFNPNVSNWNTSSVTNMYSMFSDCSGASFNPDVSSWDMSKVTDMGYMFKSCSGDVFSPNVSNWKTSSVTNMGHMFTNCSGASFNPDVSNWNTSSVTSMNSMFYNCSGASFNPDVSDWNTSRVTDMSWVFGDCSGASFTSLDVSKWDFTNTSYYLGLQGCTNLKQLKVSETSKVFGVPEHAAQDKYLSTWRNTNRGITGSTAANMVTTINAGNGAGTWEWEIVPTLSFDANGGTGTMEPVTITSTTTAPAPTFTEPARGIFAGWNTAADGTGTSYAVGALIPTGSSITLYAQWSYAYAVLDASGTLTLFRSTNTYSGGAGQTVTDVDGNSYTGRVYVGIENQTGTSYSSALWYSQRDSIKSVTIPSGQVIQPKNCAAWFNQCYYLRSTNLGSLDTSQCTDMYAMFSECSAIITPPDVSQWNTSNVTNMRSMFSDCPKMTTSPDVSQWNTGNVTNMRNMFGNSSAMTTLDLSSFDTSKVTDMYNMFSGCTALNSVTLGENFSFKGNNITSTSSQAILPTPTTSLYSGKWINTSVTGASAVTPADLRNNYNGSATTGDYARGTYVRELAGNAYAVLDANGTLTLFRSTNTYSAGANQTVTDVNGRSYTGQVYTNIENQTGTSAPWSSQRTSIKSVTIPSGQVIQPKNCAGWFTNCTNLTSTNLGSLDTSQCTDMSSMFSYCTKMTTPPNVSQWNTSNVTNMYQMFHYCEAMATPPNVSGWNTSNVTNMGGIFQHCSKMTAPPDVSHWDTDNVTDMSYIFSGCYAMTMPPNVSGWNTSNVRNVSGTFFDCPAMTTPPDVSEWNTSNVTSMSYMFSGCSKITTLDLSGFDTSEVTNMTDMFIGCNSLNSVTLGENFSFKGNTITTVSSQAILPTPTTSPYNGRWGNTSVTGANAVTPEDLRDNYNGSMTIGDYARGTYVRARSNAYAVLDANGTLTLFRSTNTYSAGTNQTVTDEAGNSYTGQVYTNIENQTGTNVDSAPWYAQRTSIKSVTIPSGQVIQPKNCAGWFGNCSNLTSTNLGILDTSQCTSMSGMFYACSAMTTPPNVSGWNTSNVTDMSQMFYACSSMTTLDLSSFDTSKVTNMSSMFNDCISLKSVTLGENFSFKGNNITSMSAQAILPTPTSPYSGKWVNRANAVTPEALRDNYDGSATTGDYARGTYVRELVGKAYAVLDADGTLTLFRSTNTYSAGADQTVTDVDGNSYTGRVYVGIENQTGTRYDSAPWHWLSTSIKSVTIPSGQVIRPRNCAAWFYECYRLTSVNLGSLDTSLCTTMWGMFYCGNMTTLDVSRWDTSNVTDMGYMFYSCDEMTTTPPDVSQWNTSNVTDISYMFQSCSAMTTPPDVSQWNTSNVTTMEGMFYNCPKMTTLDLSSFDTSKVTNMEGMFNGCTSLNSVTLGENFSFKGNNITSTSSQAILPTPTTPYTGKWVNTSVTGANAVTPEVLRDNYDGSTTTGDYARGTYVRELLCTVTFKTGNTTMGTQTVTPGTATALTTVTDLSNIPVSGNGWSFVGWTTNANSATTATHANGASISITSDTTLYAIYKRSISFKYYASATATSITTSSREQFYHNTSATAAGASGISSYALYAMTASGAAINGFSPLGWRTDGTASTATNAQTNATTITLTPAANTQPTYRAVYSRTVPFYSGQSKATTTNITQYYNADNTWALTTATAAQCTDIANWTELGWRDDTSAAAAEKGFGAAWDSSANAFYAVYSRNRAITYANGGGTGTAPSNTNATQYYNTNPTTTTPSFTLATNPFTRTGYTFSKWDLGNAGAAYESWTPSVTDDTATKTATAQWTGVGYSVAFNANGGSGSMATQTGFVYGTAKALNANTFTAPSGYTFGGWATSAANATVGTIAYANQANMTTGTTTANATVTLYAIWNRNITFYHGSNKAASTTVTQYYDGPNAKGANITTPDAGACTDISGWTELGWRDDTTAGAKEYDFGASITPSVTIYYAAYSSTITFYQGHKDASPYYNTSATATGYYNSNNVSTVTAPAIATVSNWTARGWRDDTTAADREYAVTTATAITGFGTARAFYAVYSQTPVMSYAAGGGSGTTANTNGTTRYMNASNASLSGNATWTLASNSFTRAGYTFNKWDLGNAGTSYSVAVAWNASPNKTATAQWTAHTYTVVYNKNGGSGTNMTNSVFTYDVAANLTANSYTAPSGYTFGGWANSVANATAGTVYRANSAAHGNMTATNGATVNLYAIWKRTIAFKSGANSATTTNVTQYYDGANSKGANITTPDATTCTDISGWTEKGWRDDTTAGAKEFDFGASIAPTVTEYYAVYDTTATFYSGYNKGTTATATAYYSSNNTSSVSAPAPASISYWTANGWRADTNAQARSYAVTTATTMTGFGTNKTFYHVYSQVPVMSYAGNSNTGGSTADTNGTTRYLNSGSTTLSSGNATWTLASNGFTRTGYTFNGWNLGAAGASYSVAVAYNASPNKTATAQWTANAYTITYGGMTNAAHGTNHPTTATYDTQFTVNNPTRVGYSFTGWKIEGMDAVTHTYGSSTTTATSISSTTVTTFKNLRATSGTVTFTAQWSKNNYTITFDANGGAVSPASKSYAYASTATDLPTPTRTGYTFNGWYYDLDGTASINYGRDLMFTNATSVSFRAYAADWSVVANQRIISCTESGGWNIESNGGYIQFSLYQAGSGYKTATSSVTWASLAAGWHEFELIHTGSAATVYLDGTQIATVTVGTLGFNTTNSLFVGAEAVGTQTDSNMLFSGRVENIFIKNDATRRSHSSLKNSLTVPAQNATVKAEWINNTYTVHYNANGGSGTVADTTHTYDVASNLAANGFTAPITNGGGWSFAGWAVSQAEAKAGTVSRGGGAPHNNLVSTANGEITLYAVWKRTVTFKSGVDKGGASTSVTEYYDGPNAKGAGITTPASSAATTIGASGDRAAWTATGWRDDTTADTAEAGFSASFLPQATTCYAIYTGNVNFISGSNKAKTTGVASVYNSANTWKAITTASQSDSQDITGWTERGWRKDTTEVDRTIQYGATSFTPDQFYYYGAYSRTITFKSGVNEATSTDVTQYYNSAQAATTYSNITAPTPAAIGASGDRTAWTPLGWRDDTTASDKEVASAVSFSPSTVTTYYAVYSGKIQFKSGYNKAKTTEGATSYYNSNNVWSQITSATAADCQDITTWTELGWRPDTTATTKSVDFNTAFVPTAFAYYATYSRTGTMAYAGGTGATGSTASTGTNTQYMNSGNTNLNAASLTTTLAANSFIKTGYTFSKWDLGNAGTSYSWAPAYNAATGKTATATWTANTYSISYAGMDASNFADNTAASHGSSHPTSATYDTEFTVNNPTKTGYTFTGWKIENMDSVTHTYGSATTTATSIASTKETTFKNLRSTSGTVTFTAQWTRNQYTVTCKDVFTNKNKDLTTGNYVELGSSTKTYDYHASVSGADWGTEAYWESYYPQPYYAYYLYNSSSAATSVPANNNLVVYRYFTAWVNLNALAPDGSEAMSGTVLKFDAAYGAPASTSFTAISNEQKVTMWRDEKVTISNITPQQTYYVFTDVVATNTSNIQIAAAGNGTYTGTVKVAGESGQKGINIRTRYAGYSIRFNANGGSGTMGNLSMTYNTAKSLTTNGFAAPTTNGGSWAFAGWATTAARAKAGNIDYTDGQEVTNLAATDGATVDLYAVWKRTITFYHGAAKAANTQLTEYYDGPNAKGAGVTTPTVATCTDISGWTELGWRDDTTAGASEFGFATSIYPSTTTYYADYSRTATFTSGVNGATSATATEYYSSNGNWSVAAPAPASIGASGERPAWTTLGWRGDTTAGAKEYGGASAATITGTGTGTYQFYGAYSGNVVFKSGKADDTSTNKAAYYNSSNTWSTINAATAAECSDLTQAKTGTEAWTELGWRADTTADAKSVDFNASFAPTAFVYHATYSGNIYFRSGISAATVTKKSGYYNSHNAWSQITSATATDCADIAASGDRLDWAELGWRNDKEADTEELDFNKAFTPNAFDYYAVYSGKVHFISGVSKATKETVDGYYNSANKWSTITSKTPAAIPASGDRSAWTQKGWRTDDTAATGSVGSATSFTPTAFAYYGVYQGDVKFYSGINKATTNAVNGYYNTQNVWSAITSPTPATIGASGDRPAWTTLGWRTDASPEAQTVDPATAFVPTSFAYYGVYQGNILFKSGYDRHKTTQVAAYYNTQDIWSRITSATKNDCEDVATWTELGWRNDVTPGVAGLAFATQFDPDEFVYYAAYSRDISFKFLEAASSLEAVTRTRTQYLNSGTASPTAVSTYPLYAQETYSWVPLGWRTDTQATAATVAQTGATTRQVTPAYDTTLLTYYATYSRVASLHYVAGGGTGTAPAPSTATQWWSAAGTITTPSVTLRANTFTRAGYSFTGWDKGFVGQTYAWPTGKPQFANLPYAVATAQWEYMDTTVPEGAASQQIRVSVPVAIHYVADTQGNLSGPTDDIVKFVNRSDSGDVHVSGIAVGGNNLDVTTAANLGDGQVRLSVRPQEGTSDSTGRTFEASGERGTLDELGTYSSTATGGNAGGDWKVPSNRNEWDIHSGNGALALNDLSGKVGGDSAAGFSEDRQVGAIHWRIRLGTREAADEADSTLMLSLHPGVDYDGTEMGFSTPIDYGATVLVPSRQPEKVVDPTGASQAIGRPAAVQASFTRQRPDGKTYSYSFTGWNTEPDGTGIQVGSPNDLVSGGYVDDIRKLGGYRMTLYATYSAIPQA